MYLYLYVRVKLVLMERKVVPEHLVSQERLEYLDLRVSRELKENL